MCIRNAPQKGRLTNKHPFSAQRTLLKHVFKRFKICLKNRPIIGETTPEVKLVKTSLKAGP
jgi:hypothetical protein